jgi:hypothetical protein
VWWIGNLTTKFLASGSNPAPEFFFARNVRNTNVLPIMTNMLGAIAVDDRIEKGSFSRI